MVGTAYSVKKITSDVEKILLDGIEHRFPAISATKDELDRPSGHVDLLVGVNYARLQPMDFPEPQFNGGLKLLRSNFGTGYVLEGRHHEIKTSPVFMNHTTFKVGHSTTVASLPQGINASSIKMVNTISAKVYPNLAASALFNGEEPVLPTAKTKRQKHKEFSFWEAEELAVCRRADAPIVWAVTNAPCAPST